MSKFWPYIAAFLLGGLLVALYALNVVKPNIIADSYIANLEQNIKKLKQSGENNTQDVTHSVNVEPEQAPQRKKILGIFKRKSGKTRRKA